jgi:glycine oxidase
MNSVYDAVIIGGGVIGCSIAYHLAKENKKVVVLEKETLAHKASGAAAGMLGAQMEFEPVDPLFSMAIKSRGMFRSLSDELYSLSGIDIELIEEGIYQLAFKEEEAAHLQKRAEHDLYAGEDARWLTASQLLEKEPSISEKALGALFFPRDGQVSPQKLTEAFMKSAIALGAELREYSEAVSFIKQNRSIKGVETNSGALFARHTILAGGVWSSDLDPSLEMVPVKGECLSFLTERPLLTGTVKYKNHYLVPKKGNRIILGATSAPGSFDENVTFRGMLHLMEMAKEIVPGIADSKFEKAWAGIRPQTRRGQPYIGRHQEWDQLFVATGHYRNGILLSPATGRMVAEQVIEKERQVYANEASD